MDFLPDKISRFWSWFSEHSAMLGEVDLSYSTIAELEKHLFSIDRLDWEIGPGALAQHCFALSPRGSIEKLNLTKEIIKMAPRVDGWEFSPAKLARKWNLLFNMNTHGHERKLDGKLWEFVAYKFKDGMYDLVFKPDSTTGLSEDDLYWAATIILDGELGEERRMKTIANIEIVTDWAGDIRKSAKKLELGLLNKIIN